MSNPLVTLRQLVAPASKRRSGIVRSISAGRAMIEWSTGGTGQVLCGVAAAVGDRVLVVGDAVAAKLTAETTKTVQIL